MCRAVLDAVCEWRKERCSEEKLIQRAAAVPVDTERLLHPTIATIIQSNAQLKMYQTKFGVAFYPAVGALPLKKLLATAWRKRNQGWRVRANFTCCLGAPSGLGKSIAVDWFTKDVIMPYLDAVGNPDIILTNFTLEALKKVRLPRVDL